MKRRSGRIAPTAPKGVQSGQKTADGFLNLNARLGLGANNLMSGSDYAPFDLSRDRQRLENIYRTSWMAGAIIDCIAEDMTRAGVDFVGSVSAIDEANFQKYLTQKGFWAACLNAIKWARLYGGAILVIDLDGQDLSAPLNLDGVGLNALRGFRVYDRWAVEPSLNELDFSAYGEPRPRYYTLTLGQSGDFGVRIHASRCLRFFGNELPPQQYVDEGFWGASVLERLYDRLVYFDNVTAGAAQLVEKAHLRTVQVEGLREILASGGFAEENLVQMFSQMRLFQSNEGVTLLDKNDVFNAHSYGFGGLDAMILQFGQQISGACGIPLVRLFGQSPAGLNATGESDLRLYYDNILSQQESRMRENLGRAFKVCFRSHFGAAEPVDFDFNFKPLWQVSTAEKVQLAQGLVNAVAAAFNAGIIDAETALQELKRGSVENDVFGSVTDEKIRNAAFEPPPELNGEGMANVEI